MNSHRFRFDCRVDSAEDCFVSAKMNTPEARRGSGSRGLQSIEMKARRQNEHDEVDSDRESQFYFPAVGTCTSRQMHTRM
jgi:hypothetical protein